MNLVVERKKMLDAVTMGSSMTMKAKGAMPALEMCKLSFTKDTCVLRVSSYDGESACMKKCSVRSCDEDADVLVNPVEVTKLLRSLDDEEVTITLDATSMKIHHAHGVVTLSVTDADVFPSPKTPSDASSFDIDAMMLCDLLSQARLFTSNDALRPVLCGVLLSFNDGVMSVSASDAHILYDNSVSVDGLTFTGDVILNSRVIATLTSMIGKTENARVRVKIGQGVMLFSTNDAMLMTRNVEGRFPNVKAVIPTTHAITLDDIDKSLLKSSLERVLITAPSTSLVKISDAQDTVRIESEDIEFAKSAVENVSCKKNAECEMTTIGVNGQQLLLVMNAIVSERMQMLMNEPTRPIVLKDPSDMKKTILVMPVMFKR